MKKLNPTTLQLIKDLQDDLQELLEMETNMEVIWKLEELHHNKAFKKSADIIRKQLHKQLNK